MIKNLWRKIAIWMRPTRIELPAHEAYYQYITSESITEALLTEYWERMRDEAARVEQDYGRDVLERARGRAESNIASREKYNQEVRDRAIARQKAEEEKRGEHERQLLEMTQWQIDKLRHDPNWNDLTDAQIEELASFEDSQYLGKFQGICFFSFKEIPLGWVGLISPAGKKYFVKNVMVEKKVDRLEGDDE